jgi:hypothetical protein
MRRTSFTETISSRSKILPECAAVKKQLESLQTLRGKNYMEAEHQEQEWTQLTQSIIERSFGNPSTNLNNFHPARWAGEHAMVPYGAGVPHAANQRNFEARIKSGFAANPVAL